MRILDRLVPLILFLFMICAAWTVHADRLAPQIYVPQQYNKTASWPVILLLHGYSGSGKWMAGYFGLKNEVSKRGFILIVPNGTENSKGLKFWNATDACCDFDHTGVDDVGYLLGLIKNVQSQYNVDSKRIYVVGHSNGGFMAHRLACETDGVFAATADLAGAAYKNREDCRIQKPISALHAHALDDKTIKYDGDNYSSALSTVFRLVDRDKCQKFEGTLPELNLVSLIPGTDTKVQRWSDCVDNTEVVLWTIRPYSAFFHNAHVPYINSNFVNGVLDFLFAHPKL
jgi:polyhydroxybutyrate depolymerase